MIPGLGAATECPDQLSSSSSRDRVTRKSAPPSLLVPLNQPHKGAREPGNTLYDTIPLTSEIPVIIRLLHKLVTAEASHTLFFRGFRGAAWTATYVSDILGRKICAVNPEGVTVPISNGYNSFWVIFDLSSTNNKCELYHEGQVLELIGFQGGSPAIEARWSIDCSVVNFFQLPHPDLEKETPIGYLRL
ncbi:hypothetical protein BBP40_005011 [Aspergillus hancockii]|nr:hypothetical protein BBP40_005011 [Aspergillus hancockii]